MNQTGNRPTLDPSRAHVCPTCRDLGTVEAAGKPGMHVGCPECQRRKAEPAAIARDPVTAAEREEGDRRVAEASYGGRPMTLREVMDAESPLQSTAQARAWLDGLKAGAAHQRLQAERRRHDDLVPRLVFVGLAGLLVGGALGWYAPSIASWLLRVGA